MSKQFKKTVWVQDDGSAAASIEYRGTVRSLGKFNNMADADEAAATWVKNNITAENKGKAA